MNNYTPYMNFEANPLYLTARINLALKAKLYDSGVVFARNGKIVTLKGRALDNHIRKLKKELAALEASPLEANQPS